MDLAFVWSPDVRADVTGIEVFGGLRYVDQDVGLVIDPEPPGPPVLQTGVDKSYYDLLVGARYAAPINDQWRLVFSGDLSGGDTEGTWSLAAYGVYRTGPHRFYAGYRHLEMDFEGAAGETFTETFSGPAIAYGFASEGCRQATEKQAKSRVFLVEFPAYARRLRDPPERHLRLH